MARWYRSWVWAMSLLAVATAAVAQEGQADLDKATDLKLQAKSLRDLQQVIQLCESALKKGLDADSKQFAEELLAATRFQRAERIAEAIEHSRPSRQWNALRRMALADLDQVLKYDKDYAEAYLLKARLLTLPGGDPQEARKAADEALKRLDDPRGKARAHLVRSRTFKDAKKAIPDVQEALKLDPENEEAMRMWAGLLMATERIDEAIAEMEKFLKKEPGDLGVRLTLVEALMKQEQYDKAIEQLNQILEANPDDPNLLLLRARAHYLREDPASARKDIEKILKVAPDEPAVLLLKSAVAAAEKKYGEAIADLEKVLKQNPGEIPWKIQLGYYHLAADRPRHAIEIFTEVLKQDPGNADALRARGDAYLSVGKHREAIADFEEALKKESDNPGLLNNLAWVLATSPDDELRDGKRALELATKACELTDYKQAHILSTLASAYAELGDFEKARDWSEKAVAAADKESEQYEHLVKELESYKQNKPWREKQNVEEKPLPGEAGASEEKDQKDGN